MKLTLLLFLIIFFFIILYIYIYSNRTIIFRNKKFNNFNELYKESIKEINNELYYFSKCSLIISEYYCQKKANDYYKTPLPWKHNLKKNKIFKPLIEPKYENDIDIIIGIPLSPSEIISRIVSRNTYMKEKKIENYKFKYIFITGLSLNPLFPMKFIKEESEKFNDILLLDIYNSYHNITSLMMSAYHYISSKYNNIKYFVRVNSDTLFYPKRLIPIIKENDYDIIAQFRYSQNANIYYPEGAFYIFSYKLMKLTYEHINIIKRSYRWDDVMYGKIINHINKRHNDTIKIYNVSDIYIKAWIKSRKDMINKNYIGIHPLSSSAILYLYNKYN